MINYNELEPGIYGLALGDLADYLYNNGNDVSENTENQVACGVTLLCDRWGLYSLAVSDGNFDAAISADDQVQVDEVGDDVASIIFDTDQDPIEVDAEIVENMLIELWHY